MPMTQIDCPQNVADATDGVLPLNVPSRAADHDFSLIIPAYNEEGRLPWTLAEVRRFLDVSGIDYRVIVADDGSTDGTPQLTDVMGRRFSTVSLQQNRGKGAAVR